MCPRRVDLHQNFCDNLKSRQADQTGRLGILGARTSPKVYLNIIAEWPLMSERNVALLHFSKLADDFLVQWQLRSS